MMQTLKIIPAHIQTWLLALFAPGPRKPRRKRLEPIHHANFLVDAYCYFLFYQRDDHDLTDLLISGYLSKEMAEKLGDDRDCEALDLAPPRDYLARCGLVEPEDGDFETPLLAALTAAGGWAVGHGRKGPQLVYSDVDLEAWYPRAFWLFDLDFLKAAEALQ